MRRAKNSNYNKATLRTSVYNVALSHTLNRQINLFSGGGAADVNVGANAFGEALRGNGGIAECSTLSGTHFSTQFSGGGAAGFNVVAGAFGKALRGNGGNCWTFDVRRHAFFTQLSGGGAAGVYVGESVRGNAA